MKCKLFLAALATIAVAEMKANADTVTYDTSLANPPGVYYGLGNINAGFTVDQTTSGIELGLRAKNRFPSSPSNSVIHPDSTGDYQVLGGLHDAGHAFWNYDFSVNLGASGYHLSDISAELTVQDLTVGGPALGVNLLDPAFFPDNVGYTGFSTHATAVGTDVGFQNSENPMFGNFAYSPAYFAAHASDTYQFTLTVGQGATVLASDTMLVSTPLPRSAWAGAFLLGSLGVFGLVKRRRGAVE